MRAPCVLSGPGIPVGESRDGLAYLYDLTATCLDVAGLANVSGIHGESLWSMLCGDANGRDELLLLYAGTQRALRRGRHKLIRFPKIDRTMLFDVVKDPHEMHDLSDDASLEALRAALELGLRSAQTRCDDSLLWKAKIQIPVEVDLSGKRWKPDRWQPEWIRKKYWQ